MVAFHSSSGTQTNRHFLHILCRSTFYIWLSLVTQASKVDKNCAWDRKCHSDHLVCAAPPRDRFNPAEVLSVAVTPPQDVGGPVHRRSCASVSNALHCASCGLYQACMGRFLRGRTSTSMSWRGSGEHLQRGGGAIMARSTMPPTHTQMRTFCSAPRGSVPQASGGRIRRTRLHVQHMESELRACCGLHPVVRSFVGNFAACPALSVTATRGCVALLWQWADGRFVCCPRVLCTLARVEPFTALRVPVGQHVSSGNQKRFARVIVYLILMTGSWRAHVTKPRHVPAKPKAKGLLGNKIYSWGQWYASAYTRCAPL